MRWLGDLVFVGLGQIKSLRVENLSTDPVSPFAGQLWYNTTDGVYRGYDGTTVSSFASGGNTTAIQNELDAVETAAGLNSDGTFTAPVGSNYLGSITTLKGGLVALDTQAKTNADGITTLTTDLGTANTNISNLQTEVNAIETGAGLNTDGTFTAAVGTNYISAAASLKAADVALDTQVKQNSDDILTKLNLSGGTLTGNLVITTGSHITLPDAPAADTEAVNKIYVDSRLAGLKWKDSVVAAVFSNITLSGEQTIDGVSVVAGQRVLVGGQTDAFDNGIYVAATGAWTRATDFDSTTPINEITSAAVWVDAGGTSYGNTGWTVNVAVTTLGTDPITWVQFNGAAGISAGVGIAKDGNTLSVKLGAGIAELPSNEVGVDLYASSGLFLTTDGTAASSATGAQLAVLLDGTTLTRSATGVKVTDAGISETQLASSVAGGGLTGGAGTALAVGAGTGITVNANDVALDLTYADGRYVNTSGDTLTGALVLAGDPTTNLEAATKQYVDAVNTRLGNSFYVYNGSTSNATHVVTHNIGAQYCNVTVVDSADKVIIPDSITFDSTTQLTVVFSSAITCKVVVSGLNP